VHNPGVRQNTYAYWSQDATTWGGHQDSSSWTRPRSKSRAHTPRGRHRSKSANDRSQGDGKGQQAQPPNAYYGKGQGKIPMPPLPPPTTPWTGYNMQNMPGMHFSQQMPHMQPVTPQAMAAAPLTQGPQQPLAPLAPVLHPSMPPQISVETAQKEFIEMAKARQMELPPDMRQRVQRMSKSEGAQATKDLHTAVRSLGFARKDVEEALQARCNLITSWKHFLAEAVQQWQGYTTLFQQQEQELQARIQQAHAVFATAKEQAEQSQAEAGKISTIEIVDDEEELKGEQASVEKASGQIQEGLTHLTASLQQLQASAEAIETMEKAAKRPRTSENAANDEAMEAKGDFAPDGTKPPFASPGCA